LFICPTIIYFYHLSFCRRHPWLILDIATCIGNLRSLLYPGKLNSSSKKKKWEIPQYKLVLHDGRNPKKKSRSSPGRKSTDISAKLQRRCDKLRDDLEETNVKNNKLKKQIIQLQADLSKNNGDESKSSEKSAEIEQLKDDLKKLEGLAESHKSEADRQASRASNAEKEKETVEKQLSERQKEHGMATSEAEHLQTKTNDMKKVLETHKIEIENVRKEAIGLRLKVTELESIRDEKDQTIQSNLVDIERLKSSEEISSKTL